MPRAAAIQGSYCDLKFVRSRKVAQITIEIPIEAADSFIEAFGAPNPVTECPVALARIQAESDKAASEQPKQRRRFDELGIAQRCALTCEKESFRRFLVEGEGWTDVHDLSEVPDAIREHCGVKSRGELATDPVAAGKWQTLETRFDIWMGAPV